VLQSPNRKHFVFTTNLLRSRQCARSENRLKYERERGGLAMSTGAQQPSATLCFLHRWIIILRK